ncbi:unnamed protein product, partial [Allacma fusca]
IRSDSNVGEETRKKPKQNIIAIIAFESPSNRVLISLRFPPTNRLRIAFYFNSDIAAIPAGVSPSDSAAEKADIFAGDSNAIPAGDTPAANTMIAFYSLAYRVLCVYRVTDQPCSFNLG